MVPTGTVQDDEAQAMLRIGRRVVVVDDDAAVRASLTFLLETAGYAVATFGSGPECLAAINPDTDFCLVVDQLMPQMTGQELLSELHRQGVRMPAALMVENPSADIVQRATAQGFPCVLSKLSGENDLLRFVAAAAQ